MCQRRGESKGVRPRCSTTGLSDGSARVRFRNDGGKNYLRAEAHLADRTGIKDGTKVTFAWTENAGPRQQSEIVAAGKPAPWQIQTGQNVVTRWVEYEPVPR